MSTVAATSNTNYSMWARIPSEDALTSRLNSGFKLTDRRVPQAAAQAPALPMAQIWQNAVTFDQDRRERLATEDANKKKTDQQTLATALTLGDNQTQTSKANTARTDKTKTNLPATVNNRQSLYSTGFNRSDAYANAYTSPTGYSAQGSWAKPTSGTPERLGMVLDLTA